MFGQILKTFFLDSDLHPSVVSGCPPDAFSKTGQLWGNQYTIGHIIEIQDLAGGKRE